MEDKKAAAPMVFQEVGMETEVSEVQEAKPAYPIPVTVVGIKTEVMVEQL